MSKVEDLAKKYVSPFLDEIYEVYGEHRQMQLSKFDGYDIMSAYEEGYHQAEKDLTDKAKVSSGWDGFFYGQGYKQAEKDLELTYDDICEIMEIREDVLEKDSYENLYEEILRQYEDFKERKKNEIQDKV